MKYRIHSAIFICYTVLVGWASLRPAGTGVIDPYDKLGHFVVYGLFSALAYRLAAGRGQYLLLCAGIVLYSAALEFGQSFVPGRQMSGLDLLANILGVACGALLCRSLAATR